MVLLACLALASFQRTIVVSLPANASRPVTLHVASGVDPAQPVRVVTVLSRRTSSCCSTAFSAGGIADWAARRAVHVEYYRSTNDLSLAREFFRRVSGNEHHTTVAHAVLPGAFASP